MSQPGLWTFRPTDKVDVSYRKTIEAVIGSLPKVEKHFPCIIDQRDKNLLTCENLERVFRYIDEVGDNSVSYFNALTHLVSSQKFIDNSDLAIRPRLSASLLYCSQHL